MFCESVSVNADFFWDRKNGKRESSKDYFGAVQLAGLAAGGSGATYTGGGRFSWFS